MTYLLEFVNELVRRYFFHFSRQTNYILKVKGLDPMLGQRYIICASTVSPPCHFLIDPPNGIWMDSPLQLHKKDVNYENS